MQSVALEHTQDIGLVLLCEHVCMKDGRGRGEVCKHV